MEKIYNCNTCSKAFSSWRALGGHVRSHMATASLAALNVKSPVFTEKSESDSCLTDRASDDDRGRDLGKSPRNSVESFGTGEKKIGSWSSENLCGVCKKGFGSRRALFGHMWVHSSSKQRGKVQSDHVASPVVQVSSVEAATSVRKPSLEEALSQCEIACPTTRRKRSVRVRFSGNEPGNDVIHEMGIPQSALLSSGIRKDEIEAVMGLLMISTGVGDEVGGGNKKRMLPDSDCTKSALTFQRRGYKCKSCGRIFPTQLEIVDHRVTSCCFSTEDKKVNGECTSSPSHANGPDTGLSFDGHDGKDSEGAESERDCHGTFLLDLNVSVEFSELENSIRSPELLWLTHLSNIKFIL